MREGSALLISVVLLLSCTPARAHDQDQWVEVTGPHFKVSSNSGEQEARRIARQCEEIRSVFVTDRPGFRVDGGPPLVVIAVKDEAALKVLLPDFWTGKDRVRPPGFFQSDNDENFAVLRTNVSYRSGDNPYYTLYENYVFSLLRLNYSSMPTWLFVGIGDYYGNTLIDEKYTQIGLPASWQVPLLRSSQLIPLTDLLTADRRSPFVQDRNKAPLFYSESWAIVHYLMLNPDVAQQHLLDKYLKTWVETGDATESARRNFGDLKQFESTIENYVRRPAFYFQRRPSPNFSDQDYKVRPLSGAEALVIQADFLEHTNHVPEAREMLKKALAEQPGLARVHECLGYGAYLEHDHDTAETEFEQALKLDPSSYRSHFYLAGVIYRRSGYAAPTLPTLIQHLEAAVRINPDFAPAYSFLSIAYREQPETKQMALDAALKAHTLEPAVLTYVVDIGDALIALNRDSEARTIRDTLNKSAVTPEERSMAELFAKRLAGFEETAQEKNSANSTQNSTVGQSPSSRPLVSQPQR